MTRRLVLASASPRRSELLGLLGVAFTVMPSEVDETLPPGDLDAGVEALARRKAHAVAASEPDAFVLAADTLVLVDRDALAKPADEDEARAMLARLSGRDHRVVTGVCLLGPGHFARWGRESTTVRFRELRAAEIEAYVATGEPMGKAGAYAIQGAAGAFVARRDGGLTNVVGLPLGLVRTFLSCAGFPVAAVDDDRL